MPNQIQVIIPHARAPPVIRALNSIVEASSVAVFKGSHNTLVLFRATEKKTDFILALLEKLECGISYGVIDVMTLSATKPALKSQSKGKRAYRVDDRLSMEEIFHKVDAENHLTFNYMCLTVVAGLIAAVGLATASPATVVASMLVSPLMGPIVAVTFGATVLDWKMVRKGLRNEVIGVLLTLLTGAVWGVCTAWFPEFWWTPEQTSRGTLTALYTGVAIAIPSGAGVALATTSGGSSALIGVAISAALLPPVANAGAYLAYALLVLARPSLAVPHQALFGNTTMQSGAYQQVFRLSMFSFALFLINFVCIFLTAVLFFKLKKIGPGRMLHGTEDWEDIEKAYQSELADAGAYVPIVINDEYETGIGDETRSLLSDDNELRSHEIMKLE